jgi:HEAT repeat protein
MKTLRRLEYEKAALQSAAEQLEQRYYYTSSDYASSEATDIVPLVRALPPHDRVRQLAVAAVKTGVWPTQEDTKLLVAALNNSSLLRWRRRAVAAYLLSLMTLDEEHREIAARALCRVVDDRTPVNLAGDAFLRTGEIAVVAFLVATVIGALGGGMVGVMKALAWGAPFIGSISAFALIPSFIASELAHREAITLHSAWALASLKSPHSMGTLARAASDSNFRVRNIAILTIARICRTITADHYDQLSSEITPGLCRLLSHADDKLVMVVLEALNKVGDGRAVQPVATVARRGVTGGVRSYAAYLLPILEERKRHENDPIRLLRPASASPAQQLLRPASQGGPANSAYLLRPTVEIVYRPRQHNRVS